MSKEITPTVYRDMKRAYQHTSGGFAIPGYSVNVLRLPFHSDREKPSHVGNGKGALEGTADQLFRFYLQNSTYSKKYVFHNLETSDAEIMENMSFQYDVFFPQTYGSESDVIFLLHGLNERYWHKYLPWAALLAELTGHAVVLFPLAFHMNRAPQAWSNPRIMARVAEERRELFANLKYSSLANAAISQRLQFEPNRFLISGVQSFWDITTIMKRIKSGNDGFNPQRRIHFFGYSLGALLAQIVVMSDPEGMTADSLVYLFCGGSVIERTRPVSKSILDEEAFKAVSSYLHTLSAGGMDVPDDPLIASGMRYFLSLLTFEMNRGTRESRLLEICERIKARCITGDTVCPPSGIRTTLQGKSGTIPIDVRESTLPYDFRHENPFPRTEDVKAVNYAYDLVFKEAAAHFSA